LKFYEKAVYNQRNKRNEKKERPKKE